MSERVVLSLSVLLIFALLASAGQPAAAAPMTRADYEACQAGDEARFREVVEGISKRTLESGTKGLDFKSAVDAEWRRIGMDDILDKRVDLAVEEVRSEQSWGSLTKSLVSKEKAQQLATAVAERVYQSDAVKQAVESLATGVGKEVGRTLEAASADAAGPALECMRAFLGARYGSTVAAVVAGDVEKDFGLDPSKGGAELSSGSVLKNSSEGITGAAILLVRRQLANMAGRIGQRLAGSVLSRLVSVAAGGVGLVLIAKDLWDLRHGVLPIVADEMKSAATKDKVKEELAKSISDQIGEHVQEISAKSADRMLEVWRTFRNAHQKALELAERHEGFKKFLDTVEPKDLARLDEITAALLTTEGEPGVLRRLDDGTLNEAVRFLPEPAMTIIRDETSVDAGLGWYKLAGADLPAVLEHEIYRVSKPADFTRATLAKLLTLGDHLAIRRLAALSPDAREKLFGLGSEDLTKLARNFSDSELTTLAAYLTGLDKGPRDRVLAAIATAPSKMRVLSSARVRDAVLSSADQAAAIDMMLREGPGTPEVIAADFRAAWDERISPLLIWEKHPVSVAGLGVVALIFLLMLRRLFRPRRRPVSASN